MKQLCKRVDQGKYVLNLGSKKLCTWICSSSNVNALKDLLCSLFEIFKEKSMPGIPKVPEKFTSVIVLEKSSALLSRVTLSQMADLLRALELNKEATNLKNSASILGLILKVPEIWNEAKSIELRIPE